MVPNMVYCGKASKNCQHCRTRRIKCDKLRPACSQCVRAGKQCPGYRDPLTLMFRDENTKVIQKAHAQWGTAVSSASVSDTQSVSSGSPSSAWSPFSFVNSDGGPIVTTPISRRSSSVYQTSIATPRISTPRLPKHIEPTVFEKGMQFYVDHYILGYPQEVQKSADVQDAEWLSTSDVADIMAAVGLLGLSNLTGNADMEIAARQKYGLVLRNTAQSLRNPAALALDVRTSIRTVVLLTMFEVVQGKSETPVSVRAHMMGAAALLSSLVPNIPPEKLVFVFRGIIQLCFGMFIPCHMSRISVPEAALEWIALSKQSLPPEDKSAAELILTLRRFLQLSAGLHSLTQQHSGSPAAATRKAMSDALLIEAELAAWEAEHRQPHSNWAYTTEEAAADESFPPEAVFGKRYHVYVNGMWSARVWNHYRWGRILVNQTIVELADDHSHILDFRVVDRAAHLETIRTAAEDLLVSVPTHFRHPRLARRHRDLLDRTCTLPAGAAGGTSSANVASMLAQLKVAGCAPGVPAEYSEWALRVLDTVWAETGMLQARMLAEPLRRHLQRGRAANVKVEEGEEVMGEEMREEAAPWVKRELVVG